MFRSMMLSSGSNQKQSSLVLTVQVEQNFTEISELNPSAGEDKITFFPSVFLEAEIS